jgi:Domain of unknown function (DUF4384)
MAGKGIQGAVLLGCAVAALALIANPAAAGEDIVRTGPIEVRIELEKTTYRIGEPFTFTVTTNQDCYFLVFTIDPNDRVELHDPVASGAYMGHPLLKAGERRTIPVPDAPGRAVITPPAGPYQIGAVCGREELAKLGFSNVALQEPAKAGRRSFQFHLQEKVNRVDPRTVTHATISYEAVP